MGRDDYLHSWVLVDQCTREGVARSTVLPSCNRKRYGLGVVPARPSSPLLPAPSCRNNELHSENMPPGSNFMWFADAEVDRLIDLGRTMTDPDERVAIYRQVEPHLWWTNA